MTSLCQWHSPEHDMAIMMSMNVKNVYWCVYSKSLLIMPDPPRAQAYNRADHVEDRSQWLCSFA